MISLFLALASFAVLTSAMNSVECLKNQLRFETSINALEENVLNGDIYHSSIELAALKSVAEGLQENCDGLTFNFEPNEEYITFVEVCADSLDYLYAVIFGFKAGRYTQEEILQDIIDFIPDFESSCISDSIYGESYFAKHVENVLNDRFEDDDSDVVILQDVEPIDLDNLIYIQERSPYKTVSII